MKLRGHHLVCLHFFRGRGYDKEFSDNLSNILKKVENNKIEIVNSADDVCKKCPYLKDGLCNYEENAEQEIRKMDKTAINLLNIKNKRIKWGEIKEKLPSLFKEWVNYCNECDWKEDCESNKDWIKLTKNEI